MKQAARYAVPLLLLSALFAVVLVFNNFVGADPVAADQQGVTAPANGTADSQNLTVPAQQYIGFYGNVTIQVRKTGGGPGTSLYNKTVFSGCVFVNDGDIAAPAWPAAVSPPDDNSDGNFSLTGAYLTRYHFVTVFSGTLCGVAGPFILNTTDDFGVGIFRDQNGTNSRHFVGSNIRDMTSTNGFGRLQYEVIVPKTATYGDAGYDFYLELT